MKDFINRILKFLLIGAIPFIFLAICYFILDPFKVLYSYSSYSYPSIVPNRDYVSTEMFKNNYDSRHFNSFIFGSSRTMGFRPSSWKKYLSKNDSPFVFDASSETIYGIYTKLKYLDRIRCRIDNALILLCRDGSFANTENENKHLYIHHPVTTGESSLAFQATFFKAYFSQNFLFRYYDYLLEGRKRDWMAGYIENRKIKYDPITNEVTLPERENMIMTDPAKYYAARKDIFYKRPEQQRTDSVRRIDEKSIQMLSAINEILIRNKTRFKIIISPLYEQQKLNRQDFQQLESIFHGNVYDYSGKNKFTESKFNYYESSHFRPFVGDSILKEIYGSHPIY